MILGSLFYRLQMLSARVGFNEPSYTVDEDSGFITLSVVIYKRYLQAESIKVHLTTGDDVAKESIDYEPVTAILTFAPKQTKVNIDLVILDDDYVESEEFFIVFLSNSEGALLSNPLYSSTKVIIIDDDVLIVKFGQSSYNVSEDNGYVALSVVVLNGIHNEVKVDFVTREGSATDYADFFPRISTITFAPGQTQANIDIMIRNDNRAELTEKFYVELIDSVGALLGRQSVATVNIIDNDVSEVMFSEVFYSVSENSKFVTLSIFISNEIYSNVEVDLATREGNATENTDYEPRTTTLTFLPGQFKVNTDIAIVDDDIIEPTEIFYAELSNPKGAPLGSNTLATISITDDDAIKIEFSKSIYSTDEGQSATITIVANKLWYKDLKVKLVTSEFKTTCGARAPDDYESVDTELVFPMEKPEVLYQVKTFEDSVCDPAEWFGVRLSTADPDVVIGRKSQAIIVITDPKEYGCSAYCGSCCIESGTSCPSPACYCELTCLEFGNCCDEVLETFFLQTIV